MRKVIYTAISLGYDTLKEPKVITPGWEYVCYTNDFNLKSNVWKIIPVEMKFIYQVRMLKILPPFPYDISIWLDGSMEVNCNLDDFIKKYHSTQFTVMQHPHRSCIYQEAEVCIRKQKDNPQIIALQTETYRVMDYPSNAGLVATGILVRDNNSSVIEFCKKWYSEVRQHSIRDQLSFNFVMHFNPIQYNLIPFSILTNEFIIHKHTRIYGSHTNSAGIN